MAKTLKQRMDEWEATERPKVEARYRKAAAQSDNLAEIERLVDAIELKESNSRLMQLGKALELADADLKELRHLALQKVADLKAEGDSKVAKTLCAFLDIVAAYEDELGRASGFMSGSFREAQMEAIAEAEAVLRSPPLDEGVGDTLIEVAKRLGRRGRTNDLSKIWASLEAKNEGVWRND